MHRPAKALCASPAKVTAYTICFLFFLYFLLLSISSSLLQLLRFFFDCCFCCVLALITRIVWKVEFMAKSRQLHDCNDLTSDGASRQQSLLEILKLLGHLKYVLFLLASSDIFSAFLPSQKFWLLHNSAHFFTVVLLCLSSNFFVKINGLITAAF